MKGILGKKIGMTQVFTTNGDLVPVTVIEVEPNVVTQIKTVEKDGYDAIQLGNTTIREKVIWGTSTIRHYADTLQLALSVKGQDEKIDKILNDRVKKTKREMETGGDKQW